MQSANEDKTVIQEKLKEIMKLAKEVNTKSRNYSRKIYETNIYTDLIIFDENSNEMIVLKDLMRKYNVKC